MWKKLFKNEISKKYFREIQWMTADFAFVTYWPLTEPSIKRCLCVNKRESSRSRWTLNNNITSTQTAWVSWRQGAELRASDWQRALGPQWLTVEQPEPRWGRSAAMVRRTLGQNNSPSLSPLTSHTQLTSTLFENKMWEIYFYKEVCSFVHWISYIMFDYVSAYICIYLCMRLYNTMLIIESLQNWRNKLEMFCWRIW